MPTTNTTIDQFLHLSILLEGLALDELPKPRDTDILSVNWEDERTNIHFEVATPPSLNVYKDIDEKVSRIRCWVLDQFLAFNNAVQRIQELMEAQNKIVDSELQDINEGPLKTLVLKWSEALMIICIARHKHPSYMQELDRQLAEICDKVVQVANHSLQNLTPDASELPVIRRDGEDLKECLGRCIVTLERYSTFETRYGERMIWDDVLETVDELHCAYLEVSFLKSLCISGEKGDAELKSLTKQSLPPTVVARIEKAASELGKISALLWLRKEYERCMNKSCVDVLMMRKHWVEECRRKEQVSSAKQKGDEGMIFV